MTEIDELRSKMDEITIEMIRMLKTRNDIAKKIGEIKKSIGKGITDELRENNLREKIVSLCRELNFDESVATKFLNFLLNESIKVQSRTTQTHLSIFLKAKNLELEGKKIIHMEVGEPDFLPPKNVKNALSEVYDKGFVKYGQAKGIPQFRKALADYVSKKFETKISEENILVSPGARFGIFTAIITLLNPGDEIIVIEPAWPAYKDCANFAGVKVRTINTTLQNKWEPTIEQIKEKINFNTKMIVLNYPNNPTGKILPTDLQDEIVQVAIKNNLYILSDEIYSHYAFAEWKSILCYNYEKSIVTQSFSKSHAMTGFRVGYTITNSEIIEKLAKFSALCLTNVSEPMQYVALNALEGDIKDNSNVIKQRLQTLVKKGNEMNLEFIVPDGAMYLFAKVNQTGFDGVKFANDLLEKGLAVAPGEGFGDYKNFIRISACQDEKILTDGMNILSGVLGGGE
jgi:aspartate aminotransferase